MTDVVEVSVGNASDALQLAKSIENAGASSGYIVEAANTDLSTRNATLATADGEFAEVSAATGGTTITIDSGEAYIGGTWIARDAQTAVDIPAGYSGTLSVYVGWSVAATDTVVVDHGQSGTDFGPNDPRIKLYDFTVNNGEYVSTDTDARTVGSVISRPTLQATEPGSIFDAFAMDGANDLADGSNIGNKAGEVWRAITSGDDNLYGLVGVNGQYHITYNCSYDTGASTWTRDTTGYAARLSFGTSATDGLSLRVAPSGTGNIATWHSLAVKGDGTVTAPGGASIWNGSAVPQSSLGGAASSLGTYPIPAADIADGPGSGLDADTVDGQDATAIAGDWVELDSQTITGGVNYDTGVMGTTYDRYRMTMYREHDGNTNTEDYLSMRLNGNGTTSYEFDYFDAVNNQFTSASRSSFDYLFGLRTVHGNIVMQEIEIACPTAIGTPTKQWPVFSTVTEGVSKNTNYLVSGSFEVETSAVERIEVFSDDLGTDARIRLRGRDMA